MKLKYCILSLLFFYLNISSIQAVIPQMEVSPDVERCEFARFSRCGQCSELCRPREISGRFESDL